MKPDYFQIGAQLARTRPTPLLRFPKEMELISATRNVLDAKDAFTAAIQQATTTSELYQIRAIAENLMKTFESLVTATEFKLDRL